MALRKMTCSDLEAGRSRERSGREEKSPPCSKRRGAAKGSAGGGAAKETAVGCLALACGPGARPGVGAAGVKEAVGVGTAGKSTRVEGGEKAADAGGRTFAACGAAMELF